MIYEYLQGAFLNLNYDEIALNINDIETVVRLRIRILNVS